MRVAMSCQQVREGLREYLDEVAPPGDRAGIEVHLAVCEACQRRLLELRGTAALLSALPRPGMPAGMKATLLEAFRGRFSA